MVRRLAKLWLPLLMLTALAAPAAAATPSTADHGTTLTWRKESLHLVYQPADRFYSYAPSVVRQGNTTWIWTCHNDQANTIRDHIYLTKLVDGQVTEDRSVLQGSASGWDSFHVCDPSVVKTHFQFGDQRYDYAMFYLGNDVDASAHNQVGVAFATSPEGPWVKYPEPVVTFDRVDQWGVGQPSAVSIGEGGQVLLFYTRGDTSTRAYVRRVRLGGPQGVTASAPTLISIQGLTGTDGAPDWLNGYDVAYDRSRNSFYVVREQHPYPHDNPWWIGPSVQVDRIDAADALRGTGTWQVEGDINKQLTGFDRNHNAGLVRDWRGNLLEEDRLGVVFTSSCSSLPTVENPDWSQATCDSLYSYRLWEIDGTLSSD